MGAERWTTVPRVEMSTTLGISCYLSLSTQSGPLLVDLWAPAVQNLCYVFIIPQATLSRCAAALHLLSHILQAYKRDSSYHFAAPVHKNYPTLQSSLALEQLRQRILELGGGSCTASPYQPKYPTYSHQHITVPGGDTRSSW